MDDFERRMQVLRCRFAERMQADRRILQQAWAARNYDTVRQVSHGLAGNGGLFGYPELSEAARELEQALDHTLPDEHSLNEKFEAVLELMPDSPAA